MNRTIIAIFASALSVCISESTKATTVFSADFGTLANGTTLTTANTTLGYARVGTVAGSFLYATNGITSSTAASLFTASASLTGIGTSGLTAINQGTLNFSIYSPAALSTFALFLGTGTTFTGNSAFASADLTAGFQFTTGGQLQARTGGNTSGSQSWVNVGAAGSFGAATEYDFSILFNHTASTLTYDGGSLGAYTADIYVNGLLFGDDVGIINGTGVSVTGLRMYTVSSAAPIIVDTIQLADSLPVAVPEPSTLALATIGGLGCLFALRRKR